MSKLIQTGRVRLFLMGFVFATALWAVFLACKGGSKTAPPANATAAPPPPPPTKAAGLPSEGFAPMLARVGPAVVNISATKIERGAGQMSPFFSDPFFRHFFGEPGVPRERRERSLGSGVIVGADGVILTNHHVVKDASDITIALADRRELKAKIVGSDPKTDIAVLRVEAKGLPTLSFGDSTGVRVGDLAFAVGSPFGLAQTATFGIISAVGRGDIGIVDYEDFIQTDAAINPGNSGGALVNTRGELIGINTAILSRGAQGNQGIGFAVPAQMAKSVMDAVINGGKVVRGFIGVHIQDITPPLAKAFKLQSTQGAVIANVQPDGPAAKAGLRRGDVVVAFNGQPTPNVRRLRLRIAQSAPGTVVRFTVVRGGSQVEIPVTLGTLPGEERAVRFGGRGGGSPGPSTGALEGVELQTLTPAMANRLNLPGNARGVIVVGVRPESKAGQAGLRRGDVIFEANRQRVRNLRDLEAAVAQSGGGTLLLLIGRGDLNLYIPIEP